MYQKLQQKIGEKDYIILKNDTGNCLKIDASRGASVQFLELNGAIIINNITPEGKQLNSSCSAILFPFVNRIKDGKYSFEGKDYQLHCNESARGHALHGLVYTKPFELKSCACEEEKARITFGISHTTSPGFPFAFEIEVTYTLTTNDLSVDLQAINTSDAPFPFNTGWHPYFWTGGEVATASFEATSVCTTDDRMIPTGTQNNPYINPISIDSNTTLDTTFDWNKQSLLFGTNSYQVELRQNSEAKESFLQIYTPPHGKSVAIEPMTAIADCYNNQIGLQILQPKETFTIKWTIQRLK